MQVMSAVISGLSLAPIVSYPLIIMILTAITGVIALFSSVLTAAKRACEIVRNFKFAMLMTRRKMRRRWGKLALVCVAVVFGRHMLANDALAANVDSLYNSVCSLTPMPTGEWWDKPVSDLMNSDADSENASAALNSNASAVLGSNASAAAKGRVLTAIANNAAAPDAYEFAEWRAAELERAALAAHESAELVPSKQGPYEYKAGGGCVLDYYQSFQTKGGGFFLSVPFGVIFSEYMRIWRATSITIDGDNVDRSWYKQPESSAEAGNVAIQFPGASKPHAYTIGFHAVFTAWTALITTVDRALGDAKYSTGNNTLTYGGYTYDIAKIIGASASPASAEHALRFTPVSGGLSTYEGFASASEVTTAFSGEGHDTLEVVARLAALDYELKVKLESELVPKLASLEDEIRAIVDSQDEKEPGVGSVLFPIKEKKAAAEKTVKNTVLARYALGEYIRALLGLPDLLAWSYKKPYTAIGAYKIKNAHSKLVSEPTVESAAKVVDAIWTLVFTDTMSEHSSKVRAQLNVTGTASGVGFLRELLAYNVKKIINDYVSYHRNGKKQLAYELIQSTESEDHALHELWEYAAKDAAIVLDASHAPEPSAEDLAQYATLLKKQIQSSRSPLLQIHLKMVYSHYLGEAAVSRALRNPRVGVEERGVLVATLAGSTVVGTESALYHAYTDRICLALGKAHRERADAAPLPLFGDSGDDDRTILAPAGEVLAELSRLWRAGVGSAGDLVTESTLPEADNEANYRLAIWMLRRDWRDMAEVVVRVTTATNSAATFKKGVLTYGGASLDLARIGELVESPAPAELARELDDRAILVRSYEGTTESAVRQTFHDSDLRDVAQLASLEFVLERAMAADTNNKDSELAIARSFVGSLVSAAFGLPGPLGYITRNNWNEAIVGVRKLQRAHLAMAADPSVLNAAHVSAAIIGIYFAEEGDPSSSASSFWSELDRNVLGTKQGIASVEDTLGLYLEQMLRYYRLNLESDFYEGGAVGARAREFDAKDHALVAAVRLIADDAARVLALRKEEAPEISEAVAKDAMSKLPPETEMTFLSAPNFLQKTLSKLRGPKFGARKRFV
jgi:hypothetical protein